MAGDRGFKGTQSKKEKPLLREQGRLWIGARGRNRTGTPFGEGFSYHFDFRRQRTRAVRGLEHAFTIAFRP